MSNQAEAEPVKTVRKPTPEFLREYIRLAVKSGEVARTDPYKSSISTANSGLAFGVMQHDTGPYARNKMAQEYFRKILDADVTGRHLSKAEADSLYKTALKKPQALSKADIKKVDAALMRQWALVDEADDKQLDVVITHVEGALKAAENNPNGPGGLNRNSPDLGFVAELAMWANRTGNLSGSSRHIAKMHSITRAAFEAEYLSLQHLFTKANKPEDFSKWLEKVNRAIKDAEEGTRHGRTPSRVPSPQRSNWGPCTLTVAPREAAAWWPT